MWDTYTSTRSTFTPQGSVASSRWAWKDMDSIKFDLMCFLYHYSVQNCNLSSKNIPHVILFESLHAWQVNGWEMESQTVQTEQLNTWERIKKSIILNQLSIS